MLQVSEFPSDDPGATVCSRCLTAPARAPRRPAVTAVPARRVVDHRPLTGRGDLEARAARARRTASQVLVDAHRQEFAELVGGDRPMGRGAALTELAARYPEEHREALDAARAEEQLPPLPRTS